MVGPRKLNGMATASFLRDGIILGGPVSPLVHC
jgi:hypothetical protein